MRVKNAVKIIIKEAQMEYSVKGTELGEGWAYIGASLISI
jgi:hypothetical protein